MKPTKPTPAQFAAMVARTFGVKVKVTPDAVKVVDTTPKTDAARWFDSQSFGR